MIYPSEKFFQIAPLFINIVQTAVPKFRDSLRPPEVNYRTWSPPPSSLAIEYSNQVLREVQLTSLLGDSQGVLFGTRHGPGIRIVAARRSLKPAAFESDPRLDGLTPVGVFFARLRGQVFLTESDLEQFEGSGAAIALVIAGTKAGFFVYEADGSIETVKSREEFWVADVTALAETGPVKPPNLPPAKFRMEAARANSWHWAPPALIASIAILFIMRSYWGPLPPISLAVHEQEGQLRISWSPNAITRGGTLEIADGAAHMSMPISPALASATYVRRTGDIQVHLTAAGHTEAVRFSGGELGSSRTEITRHHLSELESEAQALDETVERGGRRVNRLTSAINSLLREP